MAFRKSGCLLGGKTVNDIPAGDVISELDLCKPEVRGKPEEILQSQ